MKVIVDAVSKVLCAPSATEFYAANPPTAPSVGGDVSGTIGAISVNSALGAQLAFIAFTGTTSTYLYTGIIQPSGPSFFIVSGPPQNGDVFSGSNGNGTAIVSGATVPGIIFITQDAGNTWIQQV